MTVLHTLVRWLKEATHMPKGTTAAAYGRPQGAFDIRFLNLAQHDVLLVDWPEGRVEAWLYGESRIKAAPTEEQLQAIHDHYAAAFAAVCKAP